MDQTLDRRTLLRRGGGLMAAGAALAVLGPEGAPVTAVFCRPGCRFSDPTPTSNPIPGNHGHPVTFPIPLVVSGGLPGLPRGRRVDTAVRTVDVAPGVAALFGLGPPPGGWDGGRARFTG